MVETMTNFNNAAAAAALGSQTKADTATRIDAGGTPNAKAEIIAIKASHAISAPSPAISAGEKAASDTASSSIPQPIPIETALPVTAALSAFHRLKDRFVEQALFGLLVGMSALVLGVFWWHYATTNQLSIVLNFQNVPAPLVVWKAFLTQLSSETFYTHIIVSLQRVGIAFVVAAIIGISLGLVGGRSRIARAIIMPYVEIFRPIPAVAWIPLAILMWPTEEASIIYITFLGALFPIILNTMHGVEQTPEVLVRAAQSLGARHGQIFRHVVLPAALPSIATGLAVAMGVAWFSLLAGEIISGQYGIGYFTWNAYSLINYPDIVVGMLCIGFLGTLSTYAVRLATGPFLGWQQRSR